MTTPTRNFLRQRAAALVAQITDRDGYAGMTPEIVSALVQEYNELKALMSAIPSDPAGLPSFTMWYAHCDQFDLHPSHDARNLGAVSSRK